MVFDLQRCIFLLLYKGKIRKNQNTQNDAVDAEDGEGMIAHIVHKSADDQQAYQEGDGAAHQKNGNFGPGEAHTAEKEFQKLDAAGTQHGGDCHEEAEFRGGGPAGPQQNAA